MVVSQYWKAGFASSHKAATCNFNHGCDVIYAHLVGLGNLNKHVFSCRILVLVGMPKGEQLLLNHTGLQTVTKRALLKGPDCVFLAEWVCRNEDPDVSKVLTILWQGFCTPF